VEGEAQEIDWPIFWIGFIAVVAIVSTIVAAPNWSAEAVDRAFQYITAELGVLYVLISFSTLVFLLWLALGPYGRLRLSNTDQPPDFSTFSWASMLFCTGIGAGLMYWSATEWAFYFQEPPFGLEPGSPEAVEWAATYGIFHWGFTGWALYCLPAVAISVAYHVRGVPWLRMSSACEPVLGSHAHGSIGRCVDLIVMIALLGSASTGLGFATATVAAALSASAGIADSYLVKLGIAALTTVTIAISVYLGLEKGIKRLSNLNAVLALGLLGFILIAGPTGFIVKMGVNSVGLMLQNFLKMSTWTDPITGSRFVENWTVFYWAWWMALGPFVGIFVCKISRGRSIRELVFGMLGFGTLGCAVYFIVFGNYALHLQLNDILPVVDIVHDKGQAAAVAAITASLPLGGVILILLIIVTLIFAATTYDSASYTVASIATRSLAPDEHPARWHRVFWACVLGVLPAALLYLGGLKSLQTASIVVSVPMLVIFVLIAVALLKSLRAVSP